MMSSTTSTNSSSTSLALIKLVWKIAKPEARIAFLEWLSKEDNDAQ